jgi:hypothetical protein
MKQMDNTPLWVRLAWDAVPTRKIAMWIIISCVAFTLYCVPWVSYTANPLIKKLFLIDNWWWSAPMLPLMLWYWLSMKWVDQHDGWEE